MLKLVIYKKKACIYLVGGTKEAVIVFDKNAELFEIENALTYKLAPFFWDSYEGIYHKGKFYRTSDKWVTATIIEYWIKEN